MSGCSDEEEISYSESDRHGYEGDNDDDDSEIGKNEHRSKRRMGSVVLERWQCTTKAKKQVHKFRSRKNLLAKSRSGNNIKGKLIVEGGVSGRRSGCRFFFSWLKKVLE
ncbi:hypothetical protein HKD37_05G012384 [Glycine soja]